MKFKTRFMLSWLPSLAPVPALAGAGANSAPEATDLHALFSSSGGDSDPKPKRTVRARRRRPSTSPSGSREQAQAPRREPRPGTSGGGYSTGGTGGGYGTPRPSFGGPSGGRPMVGGLNLTLVGGLLILLCLCVIPFLFLRGGQDLGGILEVSEPEQPASSMDLPEPPPDPAAALPTPTPRPVGAFQPQGEARGSQTWTVMLYLDADDKILEKDIYIDLNEAERIGSTDKINIVAQVDRYRGGYQGDGNWTGTKRFHIMRDDDLNQVRSPVVVDLGEANMSRKETLVDFVTWSVQNYPAQKYVLILSDHGMGWPGGWSDPDPRSGATSSAPIASALGNQFYLNELDEGLAEARARSGIEQFEVIGMDACLMGHLEVISALAPHARYAVLSQETEPAVGWAYTSFLDALRRDSDMSGAELGEAIVASYIEQDQRIVDDQARADLVGRGSPLGGLFGGPSSISPQQLARQLEHNTTLTAIDLAAVPTLLDSVNQLAFQLQRVQQNGVAQARHYAQSFTSIFGSDVPASYIDLGNFVQVLKQWQGSADIVPAIDRVLSALDQVVIAEKHGPGKPGATGVSIYFPNSQLYRNPISGPQSYTTVARRFAEEALWDEFLAFHYAGQPFQADESRLAVPDQETAISAPGMGDTIQVSPISQSSTTAAPGQPVLLSMDISGDNIGYVYFFTGFYDSQSNSIFVADQDYLESDDTREVDGVYYPDWGEGDFTLEFEWEPLMFAIDDGLNTALAALNPEAYGLTAEEATYSVDGIYTYGDGESRYARLYFRNGQLTQVFGFNGDSDAGAPREIIPETGDSFTVLETWWDLDSQGRVVETATQEGDTLTFTDQMFAWRELDAAPGEYLVGFIVEDLDGNQYPVYTQVAVR